MATSWDEDQGQLKRYMAGEYKQIRGGSWKEWFSPPDIRLIPPLAEAFSIYGGKDTVERARRWALRNRYLLVEGSEPCAHGLCDMHCPNLGASCCPEFDHTDIWVPNDEPQSPFILTQPYRREVPEGIRAYARAHGLAVSSYRDLDGWYSDHALPIRLTVTRTEVYPWPLAIKAIVLKDAFPVAWPDDEET